MLTAGAIGVVAATNLLKKHQEKSGNELEKAFNEQLKAVKQSYATLDRRTQGMEAEKVGDGIGALVLTAAEKTDPEIAEYMVQQRNKDEEASKKERIMQLREEKISQMKAAGARQCDANSRCELELQDAFKEEMERNFRATAKINYAPVHVGDCFALIEDGVETSRIICIKQIGWGDKQCDEKEPGKVATILLEGNFTAYELKNSIFTKV